MQWGIVRWLFLNQTQDSHELLISSIRAKLRGKMRKSVNQAQQSKVKHERKEGFVAL